MKWFDTYHLETGIHGEISSALPNELGEPEAPKTASNQRSVDSILNSKYFLFQVDKVTLQIERKNLFKAVINKVCIENILYQRDKQTITSRFFDEESVIPLLSIENAVFLTSGCAEGNIDGIGVVYEQHARCFKFYIRNISYELAQSDSCTEFSGKRKKKTQTVEATTIPIPDEKDSSTSIQIPDLGLYNANKKDADFLATHDVMGILIKFEISPDTNRCSGISVIWEKTKLAISSDDVSKMFHFFSVLSSSFVNDRHYTAASFTNDFFKADEYEYILKVMKEKDLPDEIVEPDNLNLSSSNLDIPQLVLMPRTISSAKKDPVNFCMKFNQIAVFFVKNKEVSIAKGLVLKHNVLGIRKFAIQ